MFPEKVGGTLRFEGNKINWFPDGPVIKKKKTNKTLKNALNLMTTSRHPLSRSVHAQERSKFAGNSSMLSSDVILFATLHAHGLLAANSSFVRCHVTMN